MSLVDTARAAIRPAINGLQALSPIADLGIRLWVAWVFWKSGQTKIANWDSTLFLFEYEYAVPVLPFDLAALLATGVELSMPVLLAIGLATRFGALVLFVFNIVAVISYPDLNPAGVQQHQVWGLMLLVTLLHGPGKLSVDHLIRQRLGG